MFDWQKYDYNLPKHQLAQIPVVPRDSSKLFVYNTKTDQIVFDRFYNLDKHLPKNSFLVLNNTKVIPARVELTKQTGGKVICLLLVNEFINSQVIRAMVDRRVKVGERLFINNDHFFKVIDQKEKIFYLSFNFSQKWLLKKLLEVGKTPVPLYLRKTPLSESKLRKKYQTIFAQEAGSVAAPTASLHFTNRIFHKLDEKGIRRLLVTLHVGLGTFAPITDENIQEKKLHKEYFEVDRKLLKLIKTNRNSGKKLVAVGTTVTRMIESLAKLKIKNEELKVTGKTDLFIFPPYKFQMVDCLITNFHLPKSSLMMLVEAFLQYKGAKKHLTELYQTAIKENFRFYSFGDAMVIL